MLNEYIRKVKRVFTKLSILQIDQETSNARFYEIGVNTCVTKRRVSVNAGIKLVSGFIAKINNGYINHDLFCK